VLKRTSHVYIWLKKWIIDSAFTILQNAEKLMQAFFSVKRFLQPGIARKRPRLLHPTQSYGGRKIVTGKMQVLGFGGCLASRQLAGA